MPYMHSGKVRPVKSTLPSTKRIESLTAPQEARISEFRDYWLSVGLSTAPADRTSAQAAVSCAYKEAGLKPPRMWVWLGSPFSGAIGAQYLLLVNNRDQVRAQVVDQVRAQVVDQVWAQVGAQVGAQVVAQVVDQVVDQVWAQVGAQVGAQVVDQVWAQVVAQVVDQVWAQVGAQVGAQVVDQVWDQVVAQVVDQVRAQVGDQVRAQVVAQVVAQVWAQVRAQVGAQVRAQVDRCGYGLHDSPWLAFFHFCERAVGLKCCARLHGLMQIAENAGWWWPFNGACLLTERPCAIHRDERNRLHHQTQMAISYPDGWGVYLWHGVRIPAQYYERQPNAKEILAEQNIEVRRSLIERYDELTSKGQFLVDVGARVIDSAIQPMRAGENEAINELLSIELPEDPERRLVALRVIDPSTGRNYIVRVPPDQTTVRSALAWTFGMEEHEYVLEQES